MLGNKNAIAVCLKKNITMLLHFKSLSSRHLQKAKPMLIRVLLRTVMFSFCQQTLLYSAFFLNG